jgi:hypothetical protein
MFGFIIGTLSLVGLVHVLRGGRHHHFGRGWRGRGRWGWGGRGFGFFDHVFERLDTSSSQEREIRSALDELWTAGKDFKHELFESRGDVAKAFKADAFDATIMGEVFARHDDSLDKARKAAVGALAKIHAVLDERQREKLADFFERGRGGPYRSYV